MLQMSLLVGHVVQCENFLEKYISNCLVCNAVKCPSWRKIWCSVDFFPRNVRAVVNMCDAADVPPLGASGAVQASSAKKI